MLLKCAFPITAYTVAILSGIYVANYLLLFRRGSNERSGIFPFSPPMPPFCWNFLLLSVFISLAMEVSRKTFSSLKAGACFPEFLGKT